MLPTCHRKDNAPDRLRGLSKFEDKIQRSRKIKCLDTPETGIFHRP